MLLQIVPCVVSFGTNLTEKVTYVIVGFLLVLPKGIGTIEAAITLRALERLNSVVDVHVIGQVKFPGKAPSAKVTSGSFDRRMQNHVFVEVSHHFSTGRTLFTSTIAATCRFDFAVERPFDFGRQLLNRRFIGEASFGILPSGDLPGVVDRVTPHFVIILQTAHNGVAGRNPPNGHSLARNFWRFGISGKFSDSRAAGSGTQPRTSLESPMLAELGPKHFVDLPVRLLAAHDELMAHDNLGSTQITNKSRNSIRIHNLDGSAIENLIR